MAIRLFSSLVGVIIAVVVLSLSSTMLFNIAIAIVCVVLTEELLNAYDCLKYRFASTVCFAFAVVMPFMVQTGNVPMRYAFCLLCVLLLFLALLKNHETMSFSKLAYMLTTTMLSTLSLCCVIMLLRSNGSFGINYVILCLAGAWFGDSGAYFIGTKFGKHKLCPSISPKKTYEGAAGGIATVVFVFILYSLIVKFLDEFFDERVITIKYIPLVLTGICCGLLGIVGDLSASIIKRETGIKDFGKFMPGHGGLMDRFDSLLFVAPFMALTLTVVDVYL
jgi:phosphatidate cytidylyltransferase